MKKPNEIHFLANINQKALIRRDDKILAVQYPKSDRRAGGKWDMPGGRLNVGEKVLAGLRREVFEEIGADITVGKFIAVGTLVNVDGTPNFFVIYEAALVDEHKPFIFEKAEVAAARWVTPKGFLTLPMVYPEYQEALKRILVWS